MNKYIQGVYVLKIFYHFCQNVLFKSPTPTNYSSGSGWRGRGRLGLLISFSPPPHSSGSKGGGLSQIYTPDQSLVLGLLVKFSPPPPAPAVMGGGFQNICQWPTSGSRAASFVFSSANLSSKSSVCSLAAKGLLCKINN